MHHLNSSTKQKLDAAKQNDLKRQLHVGALVRVESFDPDRMTVNVQPLSRWENDGKMETPPPILAVPVGCVCGGGFLVHPWYEAGDVGLVVFLDHDIDTVVSTGNMADPNTNRQHAPEDAVFVGGIVTGKTTLGEIPKNAITLSTTDGSCFVSVGKEKITIKGNVEIDGNVTLKDMKSDSVPSYNNHVHGGILEGAGETQVPK